MVRECHSNYISYKTHVERWKVNGAHTNQYMRIMQYMYYVNQLYGVSHVWSQLKLGTHPDPTAMYCYSFVLFRLLPLLHIYLYIHSLCECVCACVLYFAYREIGLKPSIHQPCFSFFILGFLFSCFCCSLLGFPFSFVRWKLTRCIYKNSRNVRETNRKYNICLYLKAAWHNRKSGPKKCEKLLSVAVIHCCMDDEREIKLLSRYVSHAYDSNVLRFDTIYTRSLLFGNHRTRSAIVWRWMLVDNAICEKTECFLSLYLPFVLLPKR